jgi:hypothetical protein
MNLQMIVQIASAQAPGDLELAPRAFGGRYGKECFIDEPSKRQELLMAGIKCFLLDEAQV